MCGIFALFNSLMGSASYNCFKNAHAHFNKGKSRGPEESSILINQEERFFLGFHRLAINGFGRKESAQPLKKENCILICNGEIYNWKYLSSLANVACSSGSDCEIIIHLYKKYGIKQTLQLLDGVFAFILVDKTTNKIMVARDTYGVRPLFMCSLGAHFPYPFQMKGNVIQLFFASEMKMLYSFCKEMEAKRQISNIEEDKYIDPYIMRQFPPGHYMCFSTNNYTTPFIPFSAATSFSCINVENPKKIIRDALIAAVDKRIENTDRDITCLLSGGLDSSLITGIVVKLCKEKFNRHPSTIHTWSIGMEGSEDLAFAKKVADFLGTTHHSIQLSESDFLNAIEPVIYAIESDDTTTVRASVGNWLVCKYIKENSNAKVVFNGDGSDEVCGGYMYFHAAPDALDFDKECRRLLKDIHYFDVLRSDRSISSHGLEARTPFLDRFFVQSYLSLPSHIRCHATTHKCEKYLLREAFAPLDLIPTEVLWRTKEAFSDGVSKLTRSWFEIIQDFAQKIYKDKTGSEAEKAYYHSIYKKYYGNFKCSPYKWMPKFVDATDASARTLTIYKNKTQAV